MREIDDDIKNMLIKIKKCYDNFCVLNVLFDVWYFKIIKV